MTTSRRRPVAERTVRVIQWSMAGAAVFFIVGIITWIGHLIRTAWRLRDVPSASIGISLVAIPVFLTLLGVILYVFWGLLADPGCGSEPPAHPTAPTEGDRQTTRGRS
jgi:hypothetical protein